jgi:hypothetical protein
MWSHQRLLHWRMYVNQLVLWLLGLGRMAMQFRPASNKQQTKLLPITAANPPLRPLTLALQLQQIHGR